MCTVTVRKYEDCVHSFEFPKQCIPAASVPAWSPFEVCRESATVQFLLEVPGVCPMCLLAKGQFRAAKRMAIMAQDHPGSPYWVPGKGGAAGGSGTSANVSTPTAPIAPGAGSPSGRSRVTGDTRSQSPQVRAPSYRTRDSPQPSSREEWEGAERRK